MDQWDMGKEGYVMLDTSLLGCHTMSSLSGIRLFLNISVDGNYDSSRVDRSSATKAVDTLLKVPKIFGINSIRESRRCFQGFFWREQLLFIQRTAARDGLWDVYPAHGSG